MMKDVIRAGDGGSFYIGKTAFKYVTANYSQFKTTEDEIVILKGADFMRSYDAVFETLPNKNVLEFGVFEGGSIIAFALAYPDFKFVGIDIRKSNSAVIKHIQDLGLADRITIYYETSQSDAAAIARIVAKEFQDSPVGVIIDDASHDYALSKATFEQTFWRLEKGGIYCLEDWAWAHWGEPYQTQQWADKPALTNLLFEIVMLYPSTYRLIDGVEVLSNVARVRRAGGQFNEIRVDNMLRLRGKKLQLL